MRKFGSSSRLATAVAAIATVAFGAAPIGPVALATCFLGTARAAEITESGGGKGLHLEGTIQVGDFDKLRDLLSHSICQIYNDEYCPHQILLASLGGNVAEAIKIGRVVRALQWTTVVPNKRPIGTGKPFDIGLDNPQENYMCASACFFVFVAGIERDTLLFGDAILGSPSLSDFTLNQLNGNQVIAYAGSIRTTVEQYLKEMSAPTKYADLMFSVSKDEIRWIKQDDFESDFEGFIPELKDWIAAKCNTIKDGELARLKGKTLETEIEQRFKCVEGLKSELREQGWSDY